MLESLITILTVITTFFLGKLSKKSDFIKHEFIPLQNLFIGIFVAIIYYIITKDISVAVATAGLFAGGTYDIVHNLKKYYARKKQNRESLDSF